MTTIMVLRTTVEAFTTLRWVKREAKATSEPRRGLK